MFGGEPRHLENGGNFIASKLKKKKNRREEENTNTSD